jgi:beta-lactam-binding protein with PASTA domain
VGSESFPEVVAVDAQDHFQQQWIMPDLSGLSAKEALDVLKGHPFQIELKGMGVISSQSPLAGQRLSKRSRVRLVFSEP